MRVYLAGRFGRRDEFKEYAKLLESRGHESSARWLIEETDMTKSDDDERTRFAIMDMEDVAKSDALIAFTEDPEGDAPGRSRGGRHVEFGAAIMANKLVIIAGPRENIFHWLPGIQQFPTFNDALSALKEV